MNSGVPQKVLVVDPYHIFFLAKTIICDFNMAIQRQHNVIQLQITVYDAIFVEIF